MTGFEVGRSPQVQPGGIAILQSHSTVKSFFPLQFHMQHMSRETFCAAAGQASSQHMSPVLGMRNYRDEA